MNRLLLTCLTMLCISSTTAVADECDQFSGCKAKACNIEVQIRAAQQAGNASRERGLNTALGNVIEHCEDSGLRDSIEDDIRESETDLREYQQELEEKTAKLKRKIDDKQAEIEALQVQLKKLP